MSTAAHNRLGLRSAAQRVADRATAIARLEVQLAAAELKRKISELGVGIALLVGAALFFVYMLGFALAAIAAGLATAVEWWLALLIVTGGLLVVTGILAGIGVAVVRRSTPPVPEQAIAEAKLTTEVLKNGRR